MTADICAFRHSPGRPQSAVNRLRDDEQYAREQSRKAPTAYEAAMWILHCNNCARIVRELEDRK